MTDPFQYDVAFSFVAQDEALATELENLLAPRVRTFLYSKKQEQLAGTDGEATFNAVFGEQSRVVVILYRSSWGETPWTRIEATAIRNRAHERGYDFALFIPLDKPAKVPPWVPKNRLWIGFERWGISGAAGVIEARIMEQGGEPHEETLDERAARASRDADYKKLREASLNSYKGVAEFGRRVNSVEEAILASVERLNAPTDHNLKAFRPELRPDLIIVLGRQHHLSVDGLSKYTNTLSDSLLKATLWQRFAPLTLGAMLEEPREYMTRKFALDFDRSGQYHWREIENGHRSLSNDQVADEILKWFFDFGGDPVPV